MAALGSLECVALRPGEEDGHSILGMRYGDQIVVTIAIHVAMRHVVPLHADIDGMVLPLISLAVNVLVPANIAIEEGCRGNINVSIAIKIYGSDAQNKIGIVINEGLGELAGSIVAPERHMVVTIGRHNKLEFEGGRKKLVNES